MRVRADALEVGDTVELEDLSGPQRVTGRFFDATGSVILEWANAFHKFHPAELIERLSEREEGR